MRTKIGVPKEIKAQENRVSLTPSAVLDLVKLGHFVFVQTEAGLGSGFTDAEYVQAGAEILPDADRLFHQAELIVKVKEPLQEERARLNASHTLFTYLHLSADAQLTQELLSSQATCLAYETVRVGSNLPLLEPMSEIAGRMATLMGAFHLSKLSGGSGTLISGVPGVLPARVTILGGGTAGKNAAQIALGLGADVTILEVNPARMRKLEAEFPGLRTLSSTEAHLVELLPHTDLLIGAVLVPGARAPKLVKRDHLRLMKFGSVFVDIAVDQGGCAETTRPTTHAHPTFQEEGVVHYCVSNMPGAYARTATQSLVNVTLPYVKTLASNSLSDALKQSPPLQTALAISQGKLWAKEVAEDLGLPWAGNFPVE